MKLKAYAKINWHLNVVGRRGDGYHLLDMLMQPISLADDILIEEAPSMRLTVANAPYIPCTEDNLVLRAVRALQVKSGVRASVAIRLVKRIPVGAGLGGGSADAAAVLRGLNRLWQLHYGLDELAALGLTLGADIPFCVHGCFARVTGIGENVQPLPMEKRYWLVVIQPCRGLSTKEVFSSLTMGPADEQETRLQGTLCALQGGDMAQLKQSMRNDLEPASRRLRPQIAQAIASLYESGAKAAMMSGSGSAVFGVFTHYPAASAAYRVLSRRYRTCHLCSSLQDAEPVIA